MSIDIAALQSQAEHAFNAGDINTVVRNARQILAAQPEHAPAHLMLAGVAMMGRQLRMATRDALRATAAMYQQPMRFVAAVTLRLISVGE